MFEKKKKMKLKQEKKIICLFCLNQSDNTIKTKLQLYILIDFNCQDSANLRFIFIKTNNDYENETELIFYIFIIQLRKL